MYPNVRDINDDTLLVLLMVFGIYSGTIAFVCFMSIIIDSPNHVLLISASTISLLISIICIAWTIIKKMEGSGGCRGCRGGCGHCGGGCKKCNDECSEFCTWLCCMDQDMYNSDVNSNSENLQGY